MHVVLILIFLIPAVLFAFQNRSTRLPMMTISTGNVGGSWYAICSSIADWVNSRVEGYPITAIPGSGGMGNPIRIARTDADIGVTFSPFLVMARDGSKPYWESYSNLRAICSLTSNVHHFLVADNIDAQTLEEVAQNKTGLKMASGFPGDANYIILNLIFDELGMTEEDIEAWGGELQRIGTSGRVDLWKDRHINALHTLTQVPDASVTEALATRNGKLLGLSEPIRDILVKKFHFKKTDIPAETYPEQREAIPSVKLAMVLFTHRDISEEAVYVFTRTIAENESRFRESYGTFKEWKAEDMVNDLGIDIHPGALKYYKERGWL